MSKPTQLTLNEIYANCLDTLENNKPRFLSLLEEHIHLGEYIPHSFYNRFNKVTGRKRKYELTSLLWALLLQKFLSIPTDTLLITILKYSSELRLFCGFNKVPDASKITRFKQDFIDDIRRLFDSLVDVTEPICQAIDAEQADMTIYDTSGIEAYVTENNPKYANNLIRRLKSYKKSMKLNDSFDPYKAAYASMPSHARSNDEIKQLYINGHFCYVHKFGLVTNGLGIIRHIAFLDKDFIATHPDMPVSKKSDSPDEDKSIGDSTSLIPVLKDFYKAHPSFTPHTFIGDSAFDAVEMYRTLLSDFYFKRVCIPLNNRCGQVGDDIAYDSLGRPLCPNDSSLPMKCEGKTNLSGGTPALKWVCPKMKWVRHKRTCFCENPCTASPSGRMTYTYPGRNFRMYPGIARGSDAWDNLYKNRPVIEQTLNHVKDSFCVAGRKTQNAKTLHTDLLLSGVAQLITVVLADKIKQHRFIRSVKPLIA